MAQTISLTMTNGPTEILVSALTTDETFREPVAVGEHLPFGRKRYLEWARRRKEEIEREGTLQCDNYDSDSEFYGTATGTRPSNPTTPGKITAELDREEDRLISLLHRLKTPEIFHDKWSAGDDSDEETKPKGPIESSGKISSVASGIAGPPEVAASRNRGSRGRKRSIGSSPGKARPKPRWWKDDAQILEAIPSDASGIVGVMGRNIQLDRLAGRDASLYSMIRAWVRDDPDRATDRNPPPITADGAVGTSASVHRKTLSEYSSIKVPTSAGIRDAIFPGGGEGRKAEEEGHRNKHGRTPVVYTPPVDLLKWLETDPRRRSSIPYYPSQEEMKKLQEEDRAKQRARTARKRRLAIAKERLRKRGIRI